MKTNTPKFDESFIKNHDENSNKGHIFELAVEYPKHLHDLVIYHFYLKDRTFRNVTSFYAVYVIRKCIE